MPEEKSPVKKPASLYPFSEHEKNLVKACRSIVYGRIMVILHQGQPVAIEKGIKRIEL